MPFVHAVFPKARFIHIIRDGRDVTHSIRREWRKWQTAIEGRDIASLYRVAARMLRLQRYWRNRLQAGLFELKVAKSLDPRRYLSTDKWGGRAGWGVRFPGWQRAIEEKSLLEFQALQWVNCVESILWDQCCVPPAQWMSVHYEDLVTRPDETLRGIFKHLQVTPLNTNGRSQRLTPTRTRAMADGVLGGGDRTPRPGA